MRFSPWRFKTARSALYPVKDGQDEDETRREESEGQSTSEEDSESGTSQGDSSEADSTASFCQEHGRHLEDKWLAAIREKNIVFGAKLLAGINLTQVLLFLACLIADQFGCHLYPFFNDTNPWRVRISVPIFWLLTAIFMACARWPRLSIYVPTLVIWNAFAVSTFMLLPDEDWDFDLKCGWLFSEDVFNFQANTKAYQVLQVSMCMMFMSPHLVPVQKLMYFVLWGGILLFYLYTSLTDGPLSLDSWVAVVYLGSVSLLVIDHRQKMENEVHLEFKLDLLRREASMKLFRILEFMIPPFVVMDMLKNPGSVIAEHIEQVSIMFILLDKFDSFAHRYTPEQLLGILNRYFTMFDQICKKYDVTKIETVGAEYVCAVGVSPEDREMQRTQGHRNILMRLVNVAYDVLEYGEGGNCEISFKMGMHTGPVIAGVVGHKLPRFRLFGDTINTTARMMQKGSPGQVQFGEATRQCLPDSVPVTFRGLVEMKGKGKVPTYLLARSKSSCRRQISSASLTSPCRNYSSSSFAGGISVLILGSNSSMLQVPSGTTSSRRLHQRSLSVLTLECVETLERVSCSLQRFPSQSTLMKRKFDDVVDQVSGWIPVQDGRTVVEENFRQWFHESHVCKALFQKIGRHLLFFSGLTVVEVMFLIFTQNGLHDKPEISVSVVLTSMKVFLLCKGLCFAFIFSLWVVARYCSTWVIERRRCCQAFLLVSIGSVAVCTYHAYNSLEWIPSFFGQQDCVTCGLSANLVTLVFWPLYISVISTYPVLAKQSLVITAVAVALVLFADEGRNAGLRPLIFKAVFLFFAAYLPIQSWLQERALRERCQTTCVVESTRLRISMILETLLPPLLVQEIQQDPNSIQQHRYRSATIAQSDLVGFTELASSRRPKEVVEIICELFGLFDNLTDKFDIYKVETVGDAYIAGQAEEPLTVRNSPVAVIRFALAMVDATDAWSRDRAEVVSCRVGVHTGECIGAIIGSEMQRYHLFGSFMTVLEVLESTAPAGRVQISQACMSAIDNDAAGKSNRSCLSFGFRPEHQLKTSKGEVHDYEEVGGKTLLAVSTLPSVIS